MVIILLLYCTCAFTLILNFFAEEGIGDANDNEGDDEDKDYNGNNDDKDEDEDDALGLLADLKETRKVLSAC